MMLIKVGSLAQILMFALATAIAEPVATQTDAASQFYTVYQKMHGSGLPDSKQLNALSGHLSTGLQTLIRKAQTQQTRCIKANPGDKGPWVEGDMFTSNFEGFTAFKVGEVAAPKHRVRMQFEYLENGQKVTWADDVVLIQEKGRWVVDDVIYHSNQAFTNGFGSSLRNSLTAPGC